VANLADAIYRINYIESDHGSFYIALALGSMSNVKL
jgi:hypothetical protein